jgi:hypothetical protein
VIPRVHWREKLPEGTSLSAFLSSDPDRGPLRVAVDGLDAASLEVTLLRELGDDPRSGIDVFDAATITREPYTRIQDVLTEPRDMLVTTVLDDDTPYN